MRLGRREVTAIVGYCWGCGLGAVTVIRMLQERDRYVNKDLSALTGKRRRKIRRRRREREREIPQQVVRNQ